jgi:hypothetical protein
VLVYKSLLVLVLFALNTRNGAGINGDVETAIWWPCQHRTNSHLNLSHHRKLLSKQLCLALYLQNSQQKASGEWGLERGCLNSLGVCEIVQSLSTPLQENVFRFCGYHRPQARQKRGPFKAVLEPTCAENTIWRRVNNKPWCMSCMQHVAMYISFIDRLFLLSNCARPEGNELWRCDEFVLLRDMRQQLQQKLLNKYVATSMTEKHGCMACTLHVSIVDSMRTDFHHHCGASAVQGTFCAAVYSVLWTRMDKNKLQLP